MTNFHNVNTPWGKSQGGSLLAPGIKLYHTAGHGGMKVFKKLNEQIPTCFRNHTGWYEEDCASVIPFYFHFDLIRSHCLHHGMDGWSVSAEEYFAKFPKEWFRQRLEHWYIAACAIHFGTEYSDAELAARYTTREKLEQEKQRLLRKINTPAVKSGDRVKFDTPIRFSNGMERQEFQFERRNDFQTMDGYRVRISRWRNRDYTVLQPSAVPTLFD